MKSSAKNIRLTSVDELFSTEESREDAQREKVVEIALSQLHPFQNHPFQVRDDQAMQETADSIREYGVLVPAIARPDPNGGYELIAGHRRHRASQLAGKETMPVIIRELDDDAATIIMVDSNLQRETILPSEKAFAYKMKLEAMKRQAGRPKNSAPLEPNLKGTRSNEELAASSPDSRSQIQRYIRLTELIPLVLDMVDSGKIAFRPAVELSYLSKEQQQSLYDMMECEDCTPSLAQAIKMKEFSRDGKLTEEVILSIMQEEKPNQREKPAFRDERITRLIPKSIPRGQETDFVIRALEFYNRHLQRRRDQER